MEENVIGGEKPHMQDYKNRLSFFPQSILISDHLVLVFPSLDIQTHTLTQAPSFFQLYAPAINSVPLIDL
jgi:hypothetical protein